MRGMIVEVAGALLAAGCGTLAYAVGGRSSQLFGPSIAHGPRDRRSIALTFDDGPDLAKTPQVLEVLAAHGAQATFFVNGSKVRGDEHRALLQQVALAGHLVGNHSQNHADLSQASNEKLRSEVSQTHDALVSAGVTPQFFRFPFGAANCGAAAYVREP